MKEIKPKKIIRCSGRMGKSRKKKGRQNTEARRKMPRVKNTGGFGGGLEVTVKESHAETLAWHDQN